MTYLMRSIARDLDASTPNLDLGPSDRTALPVIPMARVGELRHFGGALQKGRDMPRNYVAATCDVDSTKSNFNVFSRLLLATLEGGLLEKNAFDIAFLLAADQQDELPERAMATSRLVRLESKDIALPSAFVYGASRRETRSQSTWNANNFQSLLTASSQQQGRGNGLDLEGDQDQSKQLHDPEAAFLHPQRRRATADHIMLEARKAMTMRSEDPIEIAVNELIEILDTIRVPVRRDQLHMYDFSRNVPLPVLEAYSSTDGTLHSKGLLSMSLLLLITRGDIQRHFIAANCNVKKASIRIVETAAWRGQTFPIDQRMCRIELQSGQFFQQGYDLMNRPVLYFRNMGRGPWRRDVDASVAAVLHRLEAAFHYAATKKEDFKCTLIVLMGRPYRLGLGRAGSAGASADEEDDGDDDIGNSMESQFVRDHNDATVDRIANPRINPDESWQTHTNKMFVKRIVELVSAHYPERLYQALVVLTPAQTTPLRKIFESYSLSNFVASPETRAKLKFLNTFRELQKYVSKEELLTIVGGDATISSEVFGLEKWK